MASMAADKVYDICVVGAGMIGSAAARHASCITGTNVCVIGPEEPQTRTLKDGREIFGAHYDEGRITRNSDPDYVWAHFAQESIKRYRHLESASGISFYNEAGYIIAGEEGGQFMQSSKDMAKTLNAVYYDKTEIKKRFPYFKFNQKDSGIYEPHTSGYISPRKMIDAELKVAQINGCDVIRDVASRIVQKTNKNNEIVLEITTENGQKVWSKKVLIATGAFTAFRNLLENNIRPDVILKAANVARVEISETEALRLRDMPSLYYNGEGRDSWCKDFPGYEDGNFSFYMLPPIQYPDDKYYIKAGFSNDARKDFYTVDEVRRWYCSDGDPMVNKSTAQLILGVVNGISMLSYQGDCCVICHTPTKRPYIDMINPHIGVAIGGNGWAAKSGDEIGRIAAMMVVTGKWDTPLPKEYFKFRSRGHERQSLL